MSDQSITQKVSAWAFGGAGILRHEGLAVFVPYSCVGDTIQCKLIKKKKNFAEGAIENIVTPSPHRVQPPCPLYFRCGGCQLQHVDYAEQLNYKRQIVYDALTRIGKFTNPLVHPTVPTSKQWQYRRHITLHLKEGKLGYLENDNSTLVEPKTCMLFSEEETLFPLLRKLLAQCPAARITLIKAEKHFLIDAQFVDAYPTTLLDTFKNTPEFQGGRLQSPSQKEIFGITEGTLTLDNLTFSFYLGAFLQNHPEQSAAIYRTLLRQIEALSPHKILDLYSGIGITSCLLSRLGASVDCIEFSSSAVKAAKQNLQKHAKGPWNVIEGPVERCLKTLKGTYDVAFVNPPRVGMHPSVIPGLLQKRAKHLFYLSCMPATLARDLQLLSSHYKLVDCTPFDLFPQTAHVETLVKLQLIS